MAEIHESHKFIDIDRERKFVGICGIPHAIQNGDYQYKDTALAFLALSLGGQRSSFSLVSCLVPYFCEILEWGRCKPLRLGGSRKQLGVVTEIYKSPNYSGALGGADGSDASSYDGSELYLNDEIELGD